MLLVIVALNCEGKRERVLRTLFSMRVRSLSRSGRPSPLQVSSLGAIVRHTRAGEGAPQWSSGTERQASYSVADSRNRLDRTCDAASTPAGSQVAMPVQLHIQGLAIDFPFKPYPAQIALMARLIKVSPHSHLIEGSRGGAEAHSS